MHHPTVPPQTSDRQGPTRPDQPTVNSLQYSTSDAVWTFRTPVTSSDRPVPRNGSMCRWALVSTEPGAAQPPAGTNGCRSTAVAGPGGEWRPTGTEGADPGPGSGEGRPRRRSPRSAHP